MYQDVNSKLKGVTIAVIVVLLSIAVTDVNSADQYVKSFDEFKIKERKNPIPAATRDLQYNVDYINNPCLLAPTAEVVPMLAIDELQRQYKVSKLMQMNLTWLNFTDVLKRRANIKRID